MTSSTEPPSPRIRIRRFPDWRTLRAHLTEEARRVPLPLLVLTHSDGASAALQDALRERLLGPAPRRDAARLPDVRTAARAIGDLLQRADPPGRLATPLARSLMMENALLEATDAEGAPRGNPLRLSGPLLRLLDEQARDRMVGPARPAFRALLERASRTFAENREADDGAERLFRLAGWLERVHRGYLAQLAAGGEFDLDLARRRLRDAPPKPPEYGIRPWYGIRVVGDHATGLADNQLLGRLFPSLHFLLLEDDRAPDLPEGWTAEESTVNAEPTPPPRLFTPSASEKRPLFRMTDRTGEARAAVEMLRRYHQLTGLAFRGFDRCAVAARNPGAYLASLSAGLSEAGIPFQTRFQPSLAEEPWPAGLDDALAFAEQPGRLSNGISLLRSPFFRDDRLSAAPGRLADIAGYRLADADIPNTRDPEDLDALAASVRRLGDDRIAKARRDPEDASARREKRSGRELQLAAEVVVRLAVHARTLAPIRDGRTRFRDAVQCFIGFVEACFPGAPDDAALEALRQAADPALPDTPVGDAARFRDRIRRQLRRHATNRYPGRAGVHLIAAEDAPFGDYDCLILLGVGDADWPGPRPGNVFFPTRVLERATRGRFGDARRRETRLLDSFAGLAGKAAGFTRAELEDGFPAGESPIFAGLGELLRANREERIAVEVWEEAPGEEVSPLPQHLERRAPGAVDLGRLPLSPSALVLYSRNPAQFFLERVLRLRREEALTDTGSRTARGSRLHRLMQEAAPAFFQEHGPVREENLGAALAFFREWYRKIEDPGLTREVRATEELWLFGGDSHPAALEWFLREEADRGPSTPTRIEALVEGTVVPATDSLPPLRVRGFVDRVDEGPDGRARVVEYKSGSSAGKDSAFLQARLYARLADPAEPAAMAVPFFRDRVWAVPNKVEPLDEKIRAVRDGLAGGKFPVPANEKDIQSFDWPLALRPDLSETDPAPAVPTPTPPPTAPAAFSRQRHSRPSDQSEREAAADPTRHVVLRASAGTGKTTVLTDRYVNLVRVGVPPRNILALTFTRKAAAEMKDRIVKRLGDADLREERARRPDLAEVAVSTLDAFNLGLIREFPLDAGVAPGVEVLDEREMPVVQREAMERVFTGATGFDRRVLPELPLLGKSLSSLDKIAHAYLKNRLTWRRTFEERAQQLQGNPPAPRPVLRDRFQPVEGQVRRFLAGYQGRVPIPGRLALQLTPQGGSRDALDREFLLRWLRPELKKHPTGAQKFLAGVLGEYQNLKAVLRRFSADWLDSLNERTFAPVWELLQAVEAEYQSLKEGRGVMDFDDLTSAVTRLLGRAGEFAESRFRLEARYHHLLLDEFQDTSDPQWDLLKAIAEPWTSGEGLAAEEVRRVTRGRLAAPTIFVVGDPKQSIYRFRNARVEILGRTEDWIRRSLGARGKPPVLRWNFRSTQPLRAFVNDAAAAGADADAATEEAWRFRYDDHDKFPEEGDPADDRTPEAIPLAISVTLDHEEAARRVAARIATLAVGGVPLDSIGILSRRSNELGVYRQAVEHLGIPTYLVRGAGFFETSEVRDLTALCRFLARPCSDRRAVELLRSRLFAVPAGALAALRRADRDAETPFSDVLTSGGEIPRDLPAPDAALLRKAGRPVKRWIELSKELPPSLAVGNILEETGYLARALAGGAGGPFAGQQQAANVEKALQHLRRLERGGFATFAAAARHLESAAPDGHDGTQAPLQAAGAVQVLTIHAAKGLEYEHVFLVDLNGKPRSGTSGLRVQEGDDGRWSIALIGQSSDWDIRDGGRSTSEERRCLYVGMTRAKRGLTLSATTTFKKDGELGATKGLAELLPADLWRDAALTAREHRPEIEWKRHRLAVLPPSDSG